MDKLQRICTKTQYFWSLSRIFLTICFAISYAQGFKKGTTLGAQIFMTLIFVPAILAMIFIQINGLTKSKKTSTFISICKISAAVFTIFFALIIIYVLFYIQNSALSMLLIPLWILLFASYEFITSQKTEEINSNIEIDQIGQEH